jgi:hypothetical protein
MMVTCGPVAVIDTLYYPSCQVDTITSELEALLTYRTIRQFATQTLQQQSLLEAAQVIRLRMNLCQE